MLVQSLLNEAGAAASLPAMLRQLVTMTGRAFRAKACTVRQLEEEQLSVGYEWGYRSPISRDHPIPVDKVLEGLVVGRQPILIRDLLNHPDLPESRRWRAEREGFRGFVAVPMEASNRVKGVLSLYFAAPREFSEDEVAAVRVVADSIAKSILKCRSLAGREGPTGPKNQKEARDQTILLVDDNPALRALYQNALREEGYASVLDLPPDEATRYAQDNDVGLLITDNQMPDASGLYVAEQVKRCSPKTRVLMVSASAHDISPELRQKCQIDFCLDKPCTMAALYQAVSSLLQD